MLRVYMRRAHRWVSRLSSACLRAALSRALSLSLFYSVSTSLSIVNRTCNRTPSTFCTNHLRIALNNRLLVQLNDHIVDAPVLRIFQEEKKMVRVLGAESIGNVVFLVFSREKQFQPLKKENHESMDCSEELRTK